MIVSIFAASSLLAPILLAPPPDSLPDSPPSARQEPFVDVMHGVEVVDDFLSHVQRGAIVEQIVISVLASVEHEMVVPQQGAADRTDHRDLVRDRPRQRRGRRIDPAVGVHHR